MEFYSVRDSPAGYRVITFTGFISFTGFGGSDVVAHGDVAGCALADTILIPHPATRIVRSRFPAVTIFTANRRTGPVGHVEATEPEDALVTRPGLEVVVRHLPPGGAGFLTRLIAGEPLGTAAAAALADTPAFDLAANIAGMLEAGAFAAIHQGD